MNNVRTKSKEGNGGTKLSMGVIISSEKSETEEEA